MATLFKRCSCAEGVTERKQQERIWKKCAHSATVQWRNGGRGSRLQTQTFKAKEYDDKQWQAAARWAKKVEGARAIQEVVTAPRSVGRTFREAAEAFLDNRVGPESTTSSYRGNLRRNVYDFEVDGTRFGDLPEGSVTRDHIKALVKYYESRFAPNTVASIYIAIAAVYKDLRASGRVEINPCAQVDLPEHVESRVFIAPTLEQVDVLASRLPGPWQLAVYLGHGAGLRIGESLAVRRDQILDTDEGLVLRVSRQVRSAYKLAPLKRRSPNDFRDIPVADFLRDRITDHIQRHEISKTGYLTPGRGAPYGGPYANLSVFYEYFRDGVHAAELPDEYTFHWLRHYFASVCIKKRMPLPQVAKLLGHRNSATTERVYWHLLQGSVDSARQVLNEGYEDLRLAA